MKLFKFVFRFIDDVIIFNFLNYSIFINVIYPSELVLIKNHDNGIEYNFLDLRIFECNGKYAVDLYDKRRDFNFSINKLISWNSNISKSIYFNTIFNQINRFKRICSNNYLFKLQFNDLLKHLANNNNFPLSLLHFFIKQVNKCTS